MAEPGQIPTSLHPDHYLKKKKLKHPRTTHACAFCRRRKTRCSGENPSCAACREEQIACDYSADGGPPRKKRSISLTGSQSVTPRHSDSNSKNVEADSSYVPTPLAAVQRQSISVEHSRRTSVDPPETSTFDNGLHIGPTSGVSFLYKWHGEGAVDRPAEGGGEAVPLATYGDVPLPRTAKFSLPSLDEGRALM